MNYRLPGFPILAMLFGCLAACGGASAPANSSPQGAASAVASPSSPAASGEKVNVAYSVAAAAMVPIFVAQEEGFFAKRGLDLSVQYVQAGSQPMAALLSGTVDLLYVSGEGVAARLGGADVIYISTLARPSPWAIHARPEYTTIESLRGKKIGVPGGPGSGGYSAMSFLLAKHGLKTTDVTVINSGSGANGLAAFQNNAFDAGVFSTAESIAATKMGFPALGVARDEGWEYMSQNGIVSGDYLRSHRPLLVRFLQAQIEGAALTVKNPNVGKKVMGAALKLDDAALLDTTYDQYTHEYLKVPAAPSEPIIQNVLNDLGDSVPGAKAAKPSDFTDPSLVQEIAASGFVDNAWK